MSNIDSTTISDLLGDWKWLDTTMPIHWVNDSTRLNATNLNTLSNSINNLREVTSNNENILRSAVSSMGTEVSNINSNMTNVIDRLSEAEAGLESILGDDSKNFSGRLSDLETKIGKLSTIEKKVDKMESDIPDSLASKLSAVESYCNNLDKFATDRGQINFNKFLEYLMGVVNSITDDIGAIEARCSALENMIASGTADPENADLSDNTKYYIKYEE